MMAANVQSVAFETPRLVDVEDQVRADFYALLAHLFSRAPDDRVLQSMVITQEPDAEASVAGNSLRLVLYCGFYDGKAAGRAAR